MQANTVKTAEIISFPRNNSRVVQSTSNCIEMIDRLNDLKIQSIEDSIEFLIPTLFESYMSIGFSIKDERKSKLLIETLRAMMYEHHGMHHELSDFVDLHEEVIDTFIQEGHDDLMEEAEALL